MATLGQRIRFLRRVEGGYLWLLILKKLGKKLARRRHGDRWYSIPLDSPGGIQLMREGEDWMVPLLRKLLPKTEGSFVDVGANVGHSLLQYRAVEQDRPWIGFEPSPYSCGTIRSVIEANSLRNTRLIEAGLSDRSSESILHGVSGTDGSATMLADYHGPGHPEQAVQMKVRVIDGASLQDTEFKDRVGFIKVDVEGMETEVISGLKDVIERDRPLIACEILPVLDSGTERATALLDRQTALMETLRSLRYRLVHIGLDGKFRDVDAPINNIDPHDGNYLILPEERFEELRPLL